MRFRPGPMDTITDFYEGIEKPTRAENEALARTDRTELARRNVPLVVYVVAKLLRMPGAGNGARAGFMHGDGAKIGFGLEHRTRVDDLIQDGIVGLIRACQTFDPSKGMFSTHAIPNIISAIQILDSRQSTVHLPTDVQRRIRVEPETLTEAMRACAYAVLGGYSQLDAPFGSSTEGSEQETLADYIEAHDPDAEDTMTARSALDALDPLERRVIEHRYGIVGPPLDLQATGKRLDLTRREVREIERAAMKKMQAAT